MKTLWYISLVAILALSACDRSTPTDVSYPIDLSRGVEQPFMVSEGHFVNGWYEGSTNPSCLLIRDYECFDLYFSIAYIMGMDETKIITEEKMKDAFVLSIIYQGSDVTAFDIEKVVLQDRKLFFCYTRRVTLEDVSFTANYNLTVLIHDCRFDSVVFFENGRRVWDIPVNAVICN